MSGHVTLRASLVLAVRNQAAALERCLVSVVEATPDGLYEVVLVDNGSTDSTGAFLDLLEGDVQVIRNAADLGLAHAWNQAAAVARGEHLVMLDPGVEVLPGWLEALVEAADTEPELAAVGCRLEPPDGSAPLAGLVLVADAEAGLLLDARPRPAGLGPLPALERVRAVGAPFLVRAEALEAAGGVDEGYRSGLHEVDLCLALAAGGWEVACARDSVVVGRWSGPAEGSAEHDRSRLMDRWATAVSPEPVDTGGAGVVPQGADVPRVAAPVEGVNLVGYFRAELGLGESARLVLASMEAAGTTVRTIGYERAPHRQQHAFTERGHGGRLHDVNVVCLNADTTVMFAREMGVDLFEGRYTVGMWHWELEHFPAFMRDAFELVDEVWVGSDHTRRAVQAVATRPVYTFPLPIVAPGVPDGVGRKHLELSERFLFLFMFDFFSVMERKNPLALVSAFKRAFAPGEGPQLLIKTINGDQHPDRLALLCDLASRHPDITVRDGYLDGDTNRALMAAADCYVSLHRAEGFGLTCGESMALGTPVIATGYSGNTDFMTPANSYLVPWTPTTVPPGCFPYPQGARWAEPDVDAAALAMRRVWERPEEAAQRAARARYDIHRRRSAEVAAEFVRRRLDAIAGRAARPRPSLGPPPGSTGLAPGAPALSSV